MKTKTRLLIIDPQNDFCDLPESYWPKAPMGIGSASPALPVQGAHDDMCRLANFISTHGSRFDEIQVTLDSHRPVDIAHPSWWVNPSQQMPEPFTTITHADVQAGMWLSHDPALQAHAVNYSRQLGQMMIWPEHCLIGSWGHNVHFMLQEALNAWSRNHGRQVDYVLKGMNPMTEHFSAVRAEVPDPADLGTAPNQAVIEAVLASAVTLVAGEALSHCVASTMLDLLDLAPGTQEKLVLLNDCASAVPGFEAQGLAFIEELMDRGVKVSTSAAFFK